jgi:hypothetical protein
MMIGHDRRDVRGVAEAIHRSTSHEPRRVIETLLSPLQVMMLAEVQVRRIDAFCSRASGVPERHSAN